MTRLEYGIARVRGDPARDFPARAMSGGADMKFGERFNAGVEAFKANAVALAVGMLLAGIVSGVSLLILTGPMVAGFVGMCLKASRKQPVQIGDVFSAFQNIVPSLVLGLVFLAMFIGIAVVYVVASMALGMLALPLNLLGLVPAPLMAWSFIRYADKGGDFKSCLGFAVDTVKKDFVTGFVHPLIFLIVGYLGMIACCVGVYATMPIAQIAIIKAYEDQVGSAPAA